MKLRMKLNGRWLDEATLQHSLWARQSPVVSEVVE